MRHFVAPALPKVSVVIPLFRSARFLENIVSNVESMPGRDLEIIISDRHCHDDTIDRLRERYAGDPRVRLLKNRDGLDWVGHINALLREARGEYWRFLPHDDLSPAGSLEALTAALDAHPDAVLAYGPTHATDLGGQPLPERSCPAPHPASADAAWNLALALQMFWSGHFNGAFKGLIRRNVVMESRIWIRSTPGQVYPERCWLFALCLVGRFQFVPEARYVKRYYTGSTHTQWVITGRSFYNAAWVMSAYLWDLLGPLPARLYGTQDLWLNARRQARWQDDPGRGRRPGYRPAPGLLAWPLDGAAFSRTGWLREFGASRRRQVDQVRALPLPQRRH